MTDVTTLAGLNVGAQVLHLASNLLRSGLMTEGPQRFSGLPDGGGADRSKKDHDAVMARINGEFACTHLSVQQRYEGADVDRMLRRPFAMSVMQRRAQKRTPRDEHKRSARSCSLLSLCVL